MWKVTSICAERGTESFFNHLPPAPKRAGGIISIAWHTNHPSLSRDIRDFRAAEINGIPALFTTSRLDSETLPADFHSCEVMGGGGSDFQWLVPLALANFTGTFVSRQPLLREGQASAEIRRYGIYDATTVDEWSENNNDNS